MTDVIDRDAITLHTGPFSRDEIDLVIIAINHEIVGEPMLDPRFTFCKLAHLSFVTRIVLFVTVASASSPDLRDLLPLRYLVGPPLPAEWSHGCNQLAACDV